MAGSERSGRRCRRYIVVLGLVGLATVVAQWAWRRLRGPWPIVQQPEWPPLPPITGSGRPASRDRQGWVEPADGGCPDGYPVKATRTGIYHLPGGRFYDRTRPERCYTTPEAAERDGYRRAKV